MYCISIVSFLLDDDFSISSGPFAWNGLQCCIFFLSSFFITRLSSYYVGGIIIEEERSFSKVLAVVIVVVSFRLSSFSLRCRHLLGARRRYCSSLQSSMYQRVGWWLTAPTKTGSLSTGCSRLFLFLSFFSLGFDSFQLSANQIRIHTL